MLHKQRLFAIVLYLLNYDVSFSTSLILANQCTISKLFVAPQWDLGILIDWKVLFSVLEFSIRLLHSQRFDPHHWILYKLLSDHNCDRFEIDAAFTWKYQMVDVSLAVPYTFCMKTNKRLKKIDKYDVLVETQYKNKLRSGVIGCSDRLSLINFAKNPWIG